MTKNFLSDDCVVRIIGPPIEYSEGPQTSGNVMIDSQLNGLLLEARDFGKTVMEFRGPHFWRPIDGAPSE